MAVSINNPVAGLSVEHAVATGSKVMVSNDVIFTINGGPIQIINLLSECVTANDATASLVKYGVVAAGGSRDISGNSLTLANATAGTTILLGQAALSSGLNISPASIAGVQLGSDVGNRIVAMPGSIRVVLSVGSTTGTWMHYLTWKPLSPASSVSANQ